MLIQPAQGRISRRNVIMMAIAGAGIAGGIVAEPAAAAAAPQLRVSPSHPAAPTTTGPR